MPRSAFEVNLLAGGGAGIIETTATYPLDLAKTRQQLTLRGSSQPVPTVLADAFRAQGVRGLYAGISAPLISEVPRRAWKFTMNGVFKERLGGLFGEEGSRGVWASVALATCAGAAAGASETLIRALPRPQHQHQHHLGIAHRPSRRRGQIRLSRW